MKRVDLIDILFEDEWLLAVNKPARLPVHATPDSGGSDLQTFVEKQIGKKLVLFHRLDRDTTGVVLFGKDRAIATAMACAFEGHRVRKGYWAVVTGRWRSEWNRIETVIEKGADGKWCNSEGAGKTAISTFRVLAAGDEKTWLEILPKTGRTHQIRLHCLYKGHPVLGDARYGVADAQVPMALHARRLDFRHPVTRVSVQIVASLPGYWSEIWLRGIETKSMFD